jgi:hypothetical protein
VEERIYETRKDGKHLGENIRVKKRRETSREKYRDEKSRETSRGKSKCQEKLGNI